MAPFDAVEVRKDPDVQAWFSGYIEDVTDHGVVCSFEDDIWPRATFAPEDVRIQTQRYSRPDDSFDPGVGEFVELEIQRSATTPSGWRRARVKMRQRALLFVAPTERLEKGARGEVIVPRCRLRPVVPDRGGLRGLLTKAEIEINEQLRDWLSTPEAASAIGSVGHVSAKGDTHQGDRGHTREQLLLIRCDPDFPKAVLIGTEASVRRAHALLPAVFQHNLQVKQFNNAMELREKALEDRKKRIEGQAADPLSHLKATKEFDADPTHVARLIGRGGSNIQALQSLYNVKFQIIDGSSYGEHKTVKIFGGDEPSVQEALDNTQLVEEALEVDPQMNGWVIGRNHATLTEMRNVAGLQAIRLDRETQRLVFVGTRHACTQAKELYSAHMLYFETFKGMDERIEELVLQLQEHGDIQELLQWGVDIPGKHKGRGKGKGKGKGKFEKGFEKGFGFEKGLGFEKGKAKGKFKGKGKDFFKGDFFKGKGKGKGKEKGFAFDGEAFDEGPLEQQLEFLEEFEGEDDFGP